MTAHTAKRIIRDKLKELGLPPYKLTAKTVGFMDLARDECVFVRVHGWQPGPSWDTLKHTAIINGFRLEAR